MLNVISNAMLFDKKCLHNTMDKFGFQVDPDFHSTVSVTFILKDFPYIPRFAFSTSNIPNTYNLTNSLFDFYKKNNNQLCKALLKCIVKKKD